MELQLLDLKCDPYMGKERSTKDSFEISVPLLHQVQTAFKKVSLHGHCCRKGNHTNQGVDEIVTDSRIAVETDDLMLALVLS